jgi:anti-sigma regulatory factor (Ser/Thr protein kinase)
VLNREFDAGALAGLRQAVLDYATTSGMPEDQAMDVMLAVHELAANAVRHGPGHGRLRIRRTVGILRCEVSDPGPASLDGHAPASLDGHAPGGADGQPPGAPDAVPWPVEQGHGLWLVDKAADHFSVTSGPHGSLVTAEFTLPAAAASPPQAQGPGTAGDGSGC